MAKEFWINLPVKNIQRSKTFFTNLGFVFNTGPGNTDHSLCMLLGDKKIVVMLFEQSQFEGFTGNDISDTTRGTEVLLSFDAQSKGEVDSIIEKAIEGGGVSSHIPKEMTGWMYGAVFSDPDGHRWNVLYMDMNQR